MNSVILAVRNGLDETLALQSITLNAARHLEVDDRVGSLEVGKDADLVIWSGHPFDLRSQVEKTMINGEFVYTMDYVDNQRKELGMSKLF